MKINIEHSGTIKEVIDTLHSTFTSEALSALFLDFKGECVLQDNTSPQETMIKFATESFKRNNGKKIDTIRDLRLKYALPLKNAKEFIDENFQRISGAI